MNIDSVILTMQPLSVIQDLQNVINNRKSFKPKSTREEKKHMFCILKARYEKVALEEVVNMDYQHLNESQQKAMLLLLVRFEELFDRTLGDWDTMPVNFQLKRGV